MAYGLRPVMRAGARSQNGGFVKVQIENDEKANAIYNGSPVFYTVSASANAYGLKKNEAPTDQAAALSCGVLVGATWENASGEQKWGNYYDGTGVNDKSFAFIAPADSYLFQVQGNASFADDQVGFKHLLSGSGGTDTGVSNLVAVNTAANGSDAILINVGVVDNENSTSSTPDILVRFAAAGIQTTPLF
tara:strand:- start:966 stop:1535 length:570 start_codon:yes stop_codon:yes gene_type:complete